MINTDLLTEKVIGAAFKVHNTLGSGFLESVYEKSLKIELQSQNISVETQHPLKVYFKNQIVGDFIADLFVEKQLLIELKAVNKLITAHEVQLVNYLTASGIDNGLLINFGSKVEVKRKFRNYLN